MERLVISRMVTILSIMGFLRSSVRAVRIYSKFFAHEIEIHMPINNSSVCNWHQRHVLFGNVIEHNEDLGQID